MVLAGNTFYIEGNLDCQAIWGFYLKGILVVNGLAKTNFIYCEDFSMEFGSQLETLLVLGNEKVSYKDDSLNTMLLTPQSHSIKQVFNELGQKLYKKGLFDYLISYDENQPQIINTKIDFYQDFSEKARPIFNEIFAHDAFEKEKTIHFDKGVITYSFTKDAETHNIAIVNRNSNYVAVIVHNPKEEYLALNLSLFKDDSFEELLAEFEFEVTDDYTQAKAVKHWFFEANKEWKKYHKKQENRATNVDAFIETLKTKKPEALKMPFDKKNGLKKIFDYINEPEMYLFLDLYIDTFDKTSELFEYGLMRLEEEDLKKLSEKSINILTKTDNENAWAVTQRANLMIPKVFHKQLKKYFKENPNTLTDNTLFPWKYADLDYIQPFKDLLLDEKTKINLKERYYKCLYYSKTDSVEKKQVVDKLKQFGFDTQLYEKFYPKQGFDFPSEDHWVYEKIKDSILLPIIYANANYLCVYKEGILRGKVCEWHHEESNLSPMWKSIDSLLNHIENEPKVDDWIKLTRDYPQTDENFTPEDEAILETLHKTYQEVKNVEEDFKNDDSEQNRNYSKKLQSVMTICELTPPKIIADLVPFLEDKDMFVLETVIYKLGENNYYAVKEKLKQIATTKRGNEQMAAESVLKRWRKK